MNDRTDGTQRTRAWNPDAVERMTLAGLLDCGGEAASACRSALLAGDEFHVWEERVSIRELLGIYRRRERYIRRKGIPSLGFAEAIEDLKACDFAQVLLGYVKSDQLPYHFQLFLAPDVSHVVACLGASRDR
ncbi:hypothetical protein GCM10010412_041010 [Nonomuraea recticatena]|uniref:Uncharacterized protein n=1 Tax=Nonomuraea recticatena TaxID=46178 RepID=A0ABN3S0E0_9ACTN